MGTLSMAMPTAIQRGIAVPDQNFLSSSDPWND